MTKFYSSFLFSREFIIFSIFLIILPSSTITTINAYHFKAYDHHNHHHSPETQQQNASHFVIGYYPGFTNDYSYQFDASILPWNVTHLNWIGIYLFILRGIFFKKNFFFDWWVNHIDMTDVLIYLFMFIM